MTDKSLSEIRAEAGKKGGKARVKKGLAFHKDVARENARKTNQKKRSKSQ